MAPDTQSASVAIADAPSMTDDGRIATRFAILEVLTEANEPSNLETYTTDSFSEPISPITYTVLRRRP